MFKPLLLLVIVTEAHRIRPQPIIAQALGISERMATKDRPYQIE